MDEKTNLKRLKEKGRINFRGAQNRGIRRPYKSWGLLLQSFRAVMDFNQVDFAKLLGISRASLSYLECGIFDLDDSVSKKASELILTTLISKTTCIKMVEEVDKEIAKITGEGE